MPLCFSTVLERLGDRTGCIDKSSTRDRIRETGLFIFWLCEGGNPSFGSGMAYFFNTPNVVIWPVLECANTSIFLLCLIVLAPYHIIVDLAMYNHPIHNLSPNNVEKIT